MVNQLPQVKGLKTRCEYVPIRSDFSSLKNKVLHPSSRGNLTIGVTAGMFLLDVTRQGSRVRAPRDGTVRRIGTAFL